MKKNTSAVATKATQLPAANTAKNVNDDINAPVEAQKPVKLKKVALKPTKIGKAAAVKLVLDKGGKIFNITYMAINKEKGKNAAARVERNMTCRIQKDTPTSKEMLATGKLRVMEVTGDKGIKTIDLDTMIGLKINKGVYKVNNPNAGK